MAPIDNTRLFHNACVDLRAAISHEDEAPILTSIAKIESLKPLTRLSYDQVMGIKELYAQARSALLRVQNPKGIANGNLNCWANAAIQMVVNSKELAKLVFENREKPLCNALAEQIDLYISNGYVDSERIREVMTGDDAAQRDPMDLLHRLIEETNISGLCRKDIVQEATHALSGQQVEEVSSIELIINGMDMPVFHELMDNFFTHPVEHNDGNFRKFQYIDPPHQLFIQAKRSERGEGVYGRERKNSASILNIPDTYNLPAEYTVTNDSYEYQLKGCIIHKGPKDNSGHYVALEKKQDGWYLINDTRVFKWDPLRQDWLFENNLIDDDQSGFVSVDGAYTLEEILGKGYIYLYEMTGNEAGTSTFHQMAPSTHMIPQQEGRGPSYLSSILRAVGSLGYFAAYVPYKIVEVTFKTIAHVTVFSVSSVWRITGTKKDS